MMASLWQRIYLWLALAAALLSALHFAEDFFIGAAADRGEATLAIGALIVGILIVFGLIWSAEHRTSGYWIIAIVLFIQGFVFTFVFHAFELGDDASLSEIAATTGGWGPVFVLGDILAGITSLAAVIMAVYLAMRPEARTTDNPS